MLADITHWEIAEEESASDHNILKLSLILKATKQMKETLQNYDT
jgi:predicted class III extradiol MEMO1 family dioxygenase